MTVTIRFLCLLPSYPTSIITRIETIKISPTRTVSGFFLPHFHYNKDWNMLNLLKPHQDHCTSYPTSIITRIETLVIIGRSQCQVHFLPHFHYNKDWNSSKDSIWNGLSDFLPHFHYNKDWNSLEIKYTALSESLLTPLPL